MTQPTARERLERFAQIFRSGDADAALTLIDELVADFPDQAPLHWHRARVLKVLGRDTDALDAVKRVIELKPDYAPARLLRAELAAEDADGNYPESDLRRALALDAGEPATIGDDMAAPMVNSAAAGVRSGMSLEKAMAQFVSDHPDDMLAIDIAWKIYALAHEPEPNYVRTDVAIYPKFMREFAERVTAALGAQGFRVVGDYEPMHLAGQLGKPTLARIYAAADGITCAASYRMEPKWPGWIAFLLLKLTGKWQRPAVVELETAFDDGGFLITNNAGSASPFVYRGRVDMTALAADAGPAVVHSRHRERIERYRREHPNATAERVDTAERIMAMQSRITAAKSEFRRSIGYLEENELRQLLGTHYERFAVRVRAKLEQIIAAAQSPAAISPRGNAGQQT